MNLTDETRNQHDWCSFAKIRLDANSIVSNILFTLLLCVCRYEFNWPLENVYTPTFYNGHHEKQDNGEVFKQLQFLSRT